MSRRKPPRLIVDRGQWRIRDGAVRIRTGRSADDRQGAEQALADYIAGKYRIDIRHPDPLIKDVLLYYNDEHVWRTKARQNTAYNIASLARWFNGSRLSAVTPGECRRYAGERSPAAGRRDLEVLRAALRFWSREHGIAVPSIVLPPKPEPRQRWLTRGEVAALLRAARGSHLRRFILLGIYTGSRSGAILAAKWSWIDWKAGTMARREPGTTQDARKRTPRVRLGNRILAHLQRWFRDAGASDYIIHHKGQPVTKLRRSWRNAAERAGLGQEVTPHTLRHTRATWLMQSATDIKQAAGHLGMTVATFERVYGHHSPDYHEEAANVDGRKR